MATVAKPAITSIPAAPANTWIGRGTRKVAWVNHIAEGSIGAVDNTFTNPAEQVSTNFCVGKDGSIHQYVDPEGPDAPFANGNVNGPAPTVQALLAQQGGANPNYWTVSVEHEGHSGDDLTPTQLVASAQLAAYYCQRLGIPMDEDHWLGHYEFDSVTRASCPGWSRATWETWEAAVLAFVDAPPAPGPQPQPNIPSAVTRLKSAQALRVQATALRLQGMKDLAAADADDAEADVDIEAALENITIT